MMTKNENNQNLICHLRGIILDMDGVLWRDSRPIGNLPSLFEKIRSAGIKVTLATNNATQDTSQYIEKLHRFGVSLDPSQVINSANAAVFYLKQHFPQGGQVYVVGESGLVNTLKESGFIHGEGDVLAVVAGLDRQFTYQKLMRANAFIRSGALFVGTNPDVTFPTPDGLVPGAGSIVSAIQVASETQPVIVGKPAPHMLELAMQRMGTTPEDTLVIGDRLDTDIAGGQSLGCPTALVLTGVSSPEQAKAWLPAPDFIAPNLTDLLDQVLV